MADKSYGSIERVKLAEDLIFGSFASLKGKFFFETITPNMDTENISIKRYKGGFTETNYLELPIPANIILGIVDHTILDCKSVDVGINPWTGDLSTMFGGSYFKMIDTAHRCKTPDEDGFLLLKVKGKKYQISKGSEFFVQILGGSLEEAKDIKVVGIETNVKAIELE